MGLDPAPFDPFDETEQRREPDYGQVRGGSARCDFGGSPFATSGTDSRPTRSGSTANRARHDRPGAPRQGAVAAGRAAALRPVRPADDRAVLGAEGPALLQLHARAGRLRRAALPEPVRAGARRAGRRPGPGGRRAGGAGGEPGGGGRGRAGAGRAGPALAAAAGAGPLRGRAGGPAVPGVRAGEPAGRPRAGAALGGGAEGPAAGGGRVRAVAADGPRPALAPTTSGRSGRWPPTCRRCGGRRRPRPPSGNGSPGC